MAKGPVKLKVSVDTFEEIVERLNEEGIKLSEADTINLTKDIGLDRPIQWRIVQVRKDCVIEAAKVYRHQIDTDNMEYSNSIHFLNFVDDIYNYVLNGEKPKEQAAKNPEVIKEVTTTEKPKGWK